uniref:Retrovirus-related Pol polyprotein from transposon TNT 1-94 n=1 Tax=Rhizophora mucronata TaxID=61149 RepID=A0A2P2NJZ2_RHIMU
MGKMSRYTSNSCDMHWHKVKRILKYLTKIKNYGISYVSHPSVIEGYSGACWITDKEDHISISGWIFMLSGGAISWGFKKQTCIVDSIIATKFIALTLASKEVEWLKNLIYEIPLGQKSLAPIYIHYDSIVTLVRSYS